MILEVTKENNLFPLGMRFMFDKEHELFIGADEEDDVNEEYAFHTHTQYSFAIPTLLRNEEIFTEVKIEGTNENNKIDSGQEDTESKSEDVCADKKQCDGFASVRANSMCKEVQREEVEKESEESKGIRWSLHKRGPNAQSKEGEGIISGKEDQRVTDFTVIDKINKMRYFLDEIIQNSLCVKNILNDL